MNTQKNILIAQSGGPTAVINASLAGVISAGRKYLKNTGEIYGSLNGIEGIENKRIISLNGISNEESLRLLKQTPSSFLGSCRKKLPSAAQSNEVYEKIFKTLDEYNIGYFFYIGGNDSMDTVDKLSRYAAYKSADIKIVGIPKTIDNDLAITDHTPGYGSAAKFVANSMRQLTLDTGVYSMPSLIVLEIMGRNAGWLTAAAALANTENLTATDIICLPETPFDINKVISKVEEAAKRKNTVMIALSEGIRSSSGEYISENSAKLTERNDSFSHAALGGVGRFVENEISAALGIKSRTVELCTLQRCYSACASLCDINEAFNVGREGAAMAIERGLTGIMPVFVRKSNSPYEIEIVPRFVSEIANLEKKVPASMITPDGLGITEEFINYARPLIEGEPDLIYKNGVISFLTR